MPYCLAASVNGQLVGYPLTHGLQPNAPLSLGALLKEVGSVEILFIHDLTVATVGQGLGIGNRLVDYAFDLAVHDGLTSTELVAVKGATAFWTTMGFVMLNATPEIAAKLAGYGRGATGKGRMIG